MFLHCVLLTQHIVCQKKPHSFLFPYTLHYNITLQHHMHKISDNGFAKLRLQVFQSSIVQFTMITVADLPLEILWWVIVSLQNNVVS